ncbi:MAG TPA: transporter substrate-binding domain-containing protein [Leptospiraceae bacterium]|nr:transporter substrate-binding domain-containing protein [Leptospiraceae bacterium]HMW07241.1 transporter substrate-binding domain-containing protein [Leptospiraceae bacterium]HMX35480.1 transporter substrate-binding domain-containing protein [Leptospiraceae bacterium]HMY32609.1 transporter substrate-binding domain-containing protein [Leptospiraceae bacterium]HMZ63764.1 transporter substrate-binding domain-containing protein [Leptospiraceae bacterium]
MLSRYIYVCIIILFLPFFVFANEDSQLYKILKKKEIVVSVGGDYEPYYIQNPKPGYPGFEVELAKAFADYLGVNLKEVVPLLTFADHAKAIKSGRVDISFGNSSSMKRGQELGFSDSYYISSPGALVNKSILPAESEGQVVTNKIFRNLYDLKSLSGLIIGVKNNTSNYDFVKDNFPRFTIKPYQTDEAALKALNDNEINCYVADNLYLEGLLQRNPALKIKMQAVVSPVVEKQLSISMKKYDLLLMNEANFFIREMKRTREIDRLKEKYFNNNDWVR